MPSLKGKEYKRFEDIKHIRNDGSEYWSARELAPVLDYAKWENFQKTISRAMIACENSGHSVSDDFPEVRNLVVGGVAPREALRIGHMVKEADKDRGSKGDLMKVVWMKFKEDDSKQREENEDWRVC